ncbi:MAG: hypothetical protein IPH81_20765 [Candidatus Microthrix sp.]|nr:hypothetical protein [Candidatus Microthrix sp.]
MEAGLSIRPIPAELAAGEVAAVRLGLIVAGLAALTAFPLVLSTGAMLKLGAVLVVASIGVSLVILSGWAGQLSLGQMALPVWGGGRVRLGPTQNHAVDPLLAIGLGSARGAAAAVVVGLPALRIRGVYLAVTTLALALFAFFQRCVRQRLHRLDPDASLPGNRPTVIEADPDGDPRPAVPAGARLSCALPAGGVQALPLGPC